jgi:hypothetical protein
MDHKIEVLRRHEGSIAKINSVFERLLSKIGPPRTDIITPGKVMQVFTDKVVELYNASNAN